MTLLSDTILTLFIVIVLVWWVVGFTCLIGAVVEFTHRGRNDF